MELGRFLLEAPDLSPALPGPGGMDAREEALGILSKIWQKLQALPHADPVELGAFFIILTFICEYFIRALCQLTWWR